MSEQTTEVEVKKQVGNEAAIYLPNRKVTVRPIVRKKGSWLPADHDGSFMYTGCKRSYVLPIDGRRNQLIPILTAEEQTYYEKVLFMNPGDLSIYKRQDNFWAAHRFHVDVTKEGLTLDLSNPMDNLRYRVLKLNPEIAPSWAKRFDSGEFKFALVEEGEQVQTEVVKANKLQEAYKFLSEIENSADRMADFLKVYGKKPAPNAKKDFLKAEHQKLIEENIEEYLKLSKDKDFEMKIFIDNCLEIGALVKDKTKYMLPGGDIIGTSLDDTVQYLRNKKYSDILATLKAKIETTYNNKGK